MNTFLCLSYFYRIQMFNLFFCMLDNGTTIFSVECIEIFMHMPVVIFDIVFFIFQLFSVMQFPFCANIITILFPKMDIFFTAHTCHVNSKNILRFCIVFRICHYVTSYLVNWISIDKITFVRRVPSHIHFTKFI